MNHKGTIKLETERLILRDITMEDFDFIHSWCGDIDNVKYMSFGPNSEEATRSFIEGCIKSTQADPRTQYDFVFVLKSTGQVIGSGGIYLEKDWHARRFIDGTLGWILHKDYWKQGYGSEFAAELLRFGFEDCRLNRIHATCDAENYGSYRVMERSGMCREAVQKQAVLARDGSWHDQYQYAILAEDYFNERIISVRDNPSYYERAVDYFSTKWGIERKIYEDSITEAIRTDKPLPRWYLMLRGDTIIGSYGLIENDFMVRKDLMPWLCALYIEESERGKSLGAKLLNHGRGEAGKLGFERLYLCTDHESYYEKYGWEFFGMEESEFGGDTRVYSIKAKGTCDFWSAIDKLISESKIIIDRPKNTKHPRFDVTMPLDYGYLENTSSMDRDGIDVWRGSLNTDSCDALICTADLLKRDSEIKLLIGCTEEEKDIAMRFHNDSEYMKGTMLRKNGEMLKVDFYSKKPDGVSLTYVVIAARHNGKWVLVRHRQRDTYEIPGGHIESGEDYIAAAKRELFEETGAVDFTLDFVSVYTVTSDKKTDGGYLFYADIKGLGELPESEIAEVVLFDAFPEKLTYPLIQPNLHKRVLEWMTSRRLENNAKTEWLAANSTTKL